MLQPFESFKSIYIPKLLELKRYWLVAQTCHRYDPLFDADTKTCLLLTDYADSTMAKAHRRALVGDKYAALLDLQNPLHKAKLEELTGHHSKFHVCWAVVKNREEIEEKLNRRYKEPLRRYIGKHTSWRISRDTTLRPTVQLVMGELFIVLNYGGQTLRFKFEELETA